MIASLRAVIFDFDGTLVDTETSSFESWQSVLAEHGCQLPLERWEHYIGSGSAAGAGWHPLDSLEAHLGSPVDREALIAYRNQQRSASLLTLELEPGVAELVEAFRERGLKLAIASSSEVEWVRGHLDRLGVLDQFDVLCCRDHVVCIKPDPALYLLALDLLGVMADEAVAIEDSPNGARAALAAGLRTIVVPNSITRSYAFPAGVERAESLHDLTHLLLGAGI